MPKSRATGTIQPPELRALGERLAESRRRQGLSQEVLAERLRLGTDQLDALEKGDPARLPEPVFVIAQAKRVASALGINIDAQIHAMRNAGLTRAQRRVFAPRPPLVVPNPYLHRSPAVAAETGAAEARSEEEQDQELPWLPAATIAVMVLSISAVLLYAHQSGVRLSEPRLSPPAAAPAPPPAPRP